MTDLQALYDDAMFDYSTGDFSAALEKLRRVLEEDPVHFDAQLALAMCHYRQGDYASAITEGHKAEKLRPHEQLVHTNLSLFYMKSGDKKTAEHHGLQARIASWKQDMTAPGAVGSPAAAGSPGDELQMAQPKPQSFKLPEKFPDQPWKKKEKAATPPSSSVHSDAPPSSPVPPSRPSE
ncbi:MAG: tetratricopeptide repeat protein [Verrucomicrobiae bacterium]|nr:tetratricopeptide repeat protein [Verrucomicrobiae bacterium]